MKAIGYIRVSTEEQSADDKYGIEVQKQAISDYANRNDFEIVMEIFKALARLSSESLNIPAILSHTLYAEAERRGADMYLLSAIGSWGDTQTDDEVLAMTKSVNLDLMAQETAFRRKNEG